VADALLASRVLALQETTIARLLKHKGVLRHSSEIREALQKRSAKEAMDVLCRRPKRRFYGWIAETAKSIWRRLFRK